MMPLSLRYPRSFSFVVFDVDRLEGCLWRRMIRSLLCSLLLLLLLLLLYAVADVASLVLLLILRLSCWTKGTDVDDQPDTQMEQHKQQ